jgi:uncharacterized membrane protein (UPF0127 family)
MIEADRRRRPPLAVLAVLLLGTACADEAPSEPTLTIETAGGTVELRVEVADDPAERQQGLMGRRALAPDAGMVFLRADPSTSGFWMKDTLIPLSVAFWDEEERILGTVDMEPCQADPCPIYPAPGPWVGAVEVNQGYFEEHGVAAGDAVTLERG